MASPVCPRGPTIICEPTRLVARPPSLRVPRGGWPDNPGHHRAIVDRGASPSWTNPRGRSICRPRPWRRRTGRRVCEVGFESTLGDVDVTKASNPESFEPRPYIWSGPQISEARSLDRNCYVSPDFFRSEVEHIHARGWIIVGRTDEWPTAGCYRAVETVGGPVLIVRDDEGELRAFANFCRHRGAQLLEDCGVARK